MSSPTLHRLSLKKPDGRMLYLYSRRPIDPTLSAPSPNPEALPRNPHLRWHPLRQEWVAYAPYRQERVFLPPAEWNPLGVTQDAEFPTELPQGDYDVAVFENLSPSLCLSAEEPLETIVPTSRGTGVCEVVVFDRDPAMSLGQLSVNHIALILSVWAERSEVLGSNARIQYVMPFENRGVEMGVTLHHPHGQIYAYPMVPPVAAREQLAAKEFFSANGRTILEAHVEREIRDGQRILYENSNSVAFVPACARYPYEVWVTTRQARSSLSACTQAERMDVARALKCVLTKFDRLWDRPFPYLMVIHQAPTDGGPHPESHFHFEFSPPYRTSARLKFLAGTELGAGMFANDSLPEEKAAELQRVHVSEKEIE